jgi:Ni,Fe-hydrogenase I cytochrome b subunit
MFESLDDQMKSDMAAGSSKKERILCWVAAIAATVLVLGGLYLGVKMLE